MNLLTKLIYKRKKSKSKLIKKFLTKVIYLIGCDIPENVVIGDNVNFCHNCLGTVIYDGTIIEDNVRIYQNVTIGLNNPYKKENFCVILKKGSCICAGAKILCKDKLIVGENSIIGANSVLNHSIGDNEVWAGIPARKIGSSKKYKVVK